MTTRKRKPCPACGEVCQHRAADEICSECKRLIADGRKYRALSEGRDLISVSPVSHGLPHIRTSAGQSIDKFRNAFLGLINKIGVDSREYVNPIDFLWREGVYHARQTKAVPEGSRQHLIDIYRAVQEMVEASHQSGKSEGRDFILGLAAGEVSVGEFNEATVGKSQIK